MHGLHRDLESKYKRLLADFKNTET